MAACFARSPPVGPYAFPLEVPAVVEREILVEVDRVIFGLVRDTRRGIYLISTKGDSVHRAVGGYPHPEISTHSLGRSY